MMMIVWVYSKENVSDKHSLVVYSKTKLNLGASSQLLHHVL